jgi:hypothetical protein
MQNTTETQAIEIAKSMLKEGFTISLMNANEVEDFVWGYLYDMNLQYNKPIFYVDERGNQSAALVHELGVLINTHYIMKATIITTDEIRNSETRNYNPQVWETQHQPHDAKLQGRRVLPRAQGRRLRLRPLLR